MRLSLSLVVPGLVALAAGACGGADSAPAADDPSVGGDAPRVTGAGPGAEPRDGGLQADGSAEGGAARWLSWTAGKTKPSLFAGRFERMTITKTVPLDSAGKLDDRHLDGDRVGGGWSSNGAVYAYLARRDPAGPRALYRTLLDDDGSRVETAPIAGGRPEADVAALEWSARGARLLVQQSTASEREVRVVVAPGAAPSSELVTTSDARFVGSVALAPDGRWVAATGARAGVSGTWLVRIASDGALTPSRLDGLTAYQLAFAPQGSQLVSVVRPTPELLPDLFLIDLSGPTPLAPTKASRVLPGGSQITRPVWSQAGGHLAYLELNYDNTRNDLYLDPDGPGAGAPPRMVQGVDQKVSSSDSWFAFSPDGVWLAFEAYARYNVVLPTALYLASTSSDTAPVRVDGLAPDSDVQFAAFSRDSATLAVCARTPGARGRLSIVPLTGATKRATEVRLPSELDGDVVCDLVAFSPDGRWLVFVADAASKPADPPAWQLWAVAVRDGRAVRLDADGAQATVVTTADMAFTAGALLAYPAATGLAVVDLDADPTKSTLVVSSAEWLRGVAWRPSP